MERNVILASKSPRRREILENLGLVVHVLAENPEIRTAFAGDEEELPGEKPDDYGRRITVEKFEKGLAMKAASPLRDAPWPVIAADTVVTIDDIVLGKPRDARFCSVIALCYPDGRELTAEGSVEGTILEEERGKGGFGYDPLFFSPELGKTFAEATPEEKNSVSHRSRALHNMLSLLQNK